MKLQNIYECERKQVDKFARFFLLPSYFKYIGIGLFVLSLGLLIGLINFADGNEGMKLLARNVILISMLLVALTREPFEDELVEKLRGQAFSLAFITGVAFGLVQPYINYLVASLVRPEKAEFSLMGEFVILWFMLVVYLCFFHLLKKTS